MSAWLAGFSDERKARLRVDVYDIGQFYLAMSILREHGIRVRHWHFLAGTLSRAEAARCPPGVAAKDCPGGGAGSPAPLPQLALDEVEPGGLGGRESPLFAPPSERGRDGGGRGTSPGPMPEGVVPGIAGWASAGFAAQDGAPGSAGAGSGGSGSPDAGREAGSGGSGTTGTRRGLLSGPSGTARSRGFGSGPGFEPGGAATLGSFPGARKGGGESSEGEGEGRSSRGGDGGSGQPSRTEGAAGGSGPQISLRIALPEAIRREARGGGERAPALEALFGVILHYLGELQHSLDTGGTPSRQIDSFAERIQHAFQAPPPIAEAERRVARDLALKFALLPHLGQPDFQPDPLALRPAPPGPGTDAVLVIHPNRLNDMVGVGRGGEAMDGEADAGKMRAGEAQDDRRSRRGRVAFTLNAYPGIWKGLEIRVELWSVLLMPPEAHEPERMRWRAVAYITPGLDDFIVGFVFANLDAEGRLRIQADANRVRLEGRPLFTEYRESLFGSRGWLVSLYATLAGGLLLLGVGWRFLAGRAA